MAFSSLLVLGSGFQFERRAPTCNILDAFPYFKTGEVDIRIIDEKPQAQKKNQMKYMIEFSRFMNGKSPYLLQVRSLFNVKRRPFKDSSAEPAYERTYDGTTKF